MKNIDLVILAGGKGSRIKRFLHNKPKPMLIFNNIYFLQYLINNFSKYPFDNIYILTGYKSDIIFKNFHNKTFNFTKIICLKEKKLMGTGGALLNLKKTKINDFVLINGDTIFDIDLKDFITSYKKNKIGCMAVASNRKNTNSYKLNNLTLKKSLLSYKKKGNVMNGGIYFFKKKLINLIPNKPSSLEDDILPLIIKKKLISGKFYKNFFLDIGTPKYLKKAELSLKNYFNKPAAFLDRDGVINYDYGYVHNEKKFKFKNGVIKGLQYLIKKNYLIFLITNQAGIAKGIYTENDLYKLNTILKIKLLKKNIFFNDVQYCPFHPKGKIPLYIKQSNLRKPNNQMVKNVFKKFLIKKNKSFMIGDKISDKKCAQKSRLNFHYAKNNFFKQIKEII